MKSPAALIDITTNLDGVNTRKLTINADGKLFDLLADKVYTHKVRACFRELLANAADSHAAAGQSRPFTVTLPTSLDPVFTVRDYGTGMDAATVDGIYSTLMDTSKGEDNGQTGFLGIGSKSPFAVSDAFTVVCYDGAFQRTYLVARSADGVPGITLLGSDLSQEPQGVEVQVPVSQTQIREFHEEAQSVLFGFSAGSYEGVSYEPPVATLSGVYIGRTPEGADDLFKWELVSADHLDDNYYVRQGVVVYPVDASARPADAPLRWSTHHSLVVDIPIGSADVSPDRESLSLDETTRANVKAAFAAASEELLAAAERQRDEASNWLQRVSVARDQAEWRQGADSDESNLFLTGGSDWEVPTLLSGKKWGNLISAPVYGNRRHPLAKASDADVEAGRAISIPADQIAEHRFFILRPGTVRAVDRVRREAKRLHGGYGRSQYSNRFHVVDNPTPRQVERLITLLGLKPHQIIPVASLHDEKPPSKARPKAADGTPRAPLPKRLSGVYSFEYGKAELLEELPEDYLWVRSTSRAASHRVQARAGSFVEQSSLGSYLRSSTATYLGLPSVIIGFNEKALAEHTPDPAKELHVALAAVETDELTEAVDTARSIDSAINSLYHAGQIADRGAVQDLVQDYLPEGYELDADHTLLTRSDFNFAATYRGWNDTDELADGIVEAAQSAYPLLFKRSFDAADVAAYKALLLGEQE